MPTGTGRASRPRSPPERRRCAIFAPRYFGSRYFGNTFFGAVGTASAVDVPPTVDPEPTTVTDPIAWTVEDFEDELIDRTRGLLILVGLSADPDADASPRAYLKSPIAYAIRKSGGTTASVRTPVDSDLETVVADKTDQCFDIGELRLIDNALGSWIEPDQAEGPLSQKLGALGEFYLKRAECLRQKVKDVYKVDADVPQVATDGLGGFSDGGLGGAGTSSLMFL